MDITKCYRLLGSPLWRSFGIVFSRFLATLAAILGVSTPLFGQTFAIIGDYGSAGQNEEDVANLVKSWNPDFVITTGDNNYPDGEATTIDPNIGQYYHDFIYNYQGSYGPGSPENRFFPSLGNHDWNTTNAQPYIDYFTLLNNERYYDFVWGEVHFFAVDSDWDEPDGVESTSTQGQWMESALANSTSRWKIVYFHHPPYSSGSHGNQDWMQWPFEAWGASAVLAGHDHTYERIILNGFPYFVNGLGGRSRYSFGNPVPGSEVRYNSDYGAMRVVATPSNITFEFINRAGVLIDSYTIGPLSVPSEENRLPGKLFLLQNSPNPFHIKSEIQFSLLRDENVTLKIYNLLGREVTTILSGRLEAGAHNVIWEAKDIRSGTYFYHLNAGGELLIKKGVLLR